MTKTNTTNREAISSNFDKTYKHTKSTIQKTINFDEQTDQSMLQPTRHQDGPQLLFSAIGLLAIKDPCAKKRHTIILCRPYHA